MMAGCFDGKSVFITGASSGIGAACAREFARQGARIALVARRIDRLAEVKKDIEAAGGEALALEGDVRRREDLDTAVAAAVEAYGGIDVVLANAGFGVAGSFDRLSTEDFRRQFDTNFFGVLDTLYATLPHIEASAGRFGLIGSISGILGTPGTGPYTASKFAVVGLAECMLFDLASKGVSVTCINPGFIESEIRSVNNRGEYTGKKDPVPKLFVMPTEKAARQIVRALYRRRAEIQLTRHGKAMAFFARHCRPLVRGAIRMMAAKKKG